MKNKIILIGGAILLVIFGIRYFTKESNNISSNTPTPSLVPLPSESVSPSATPKPRITTSPLPTGNNKTTFVGKPVPWDLLLSDASCKLVGEIKFLNSNTYDNQDAKFTYSGIDNPGRNIIWTVSPQDNIQVGPNIFEKLILPNGESLLGIFLPGNPKYKRYELTAKVQYARLVDQSGKFVAAGGGVKIFEKQCQGKTIVVLP